MRKSTTAKLVAVSAVVLGLSLPAVMASAANSRTVPVKTGGNATFALDEAVAGMNINTSADNLFVLQEMLNMVWPGAFIVNDKLGLVLDTDLVTSAKSATVAGQQVLTYHINSKAKWVDGTPFTADDFIYNYQALSGLSQYKDIGNQTYDVAGTTGYNQVQSVKGSAPAGGHACQAGSTGNRNLGLCPNGDTVTVKFIKGQPFADWQALFGDLVPAHTARVHGWNTGFNMPDCANTSACARLGSASWYQLKSRSGNTFVLTRNTGYNGARGKLDTLTFLDAPDDNTGISDLASGTTNVFNPVQATPAEVTQAKGQPSKVSFKTISGLIFEHIDFNEGVAGLNKLAVRQAIADFTDRKSIIAHTVGLVNPATKQLGNRMLMVNQAGYVDHGKAYEAVNITAGRAKLKGAGYKMGSDGYFQTSGTGSSHDLTFNIASTTSSVRGTEMQLFQSEQHAGGIKITITPEADFFTKVAALQYQIGLFAWVGGPFISPNESIYCSYTKPICGQNWVHFANKTVDSLLLHGASANSHTTEVADFNQADSLLWSNMVTLPLYQRTEFFAWSKKYGNIVPNPSNSGITWNANLWGLL